MGHIDLCQNAEYIKHVTVTGGCRIDRNTTVSESTGIMNKHKLHHLGLGSGIGPADCEIVDVGPSLYSTLNGQSQGGGFSLVNFMIVGAEKVN
jgi:hypothetical protein